MKTATKNLIQFDQAMKLFKKFVSNRDTRPVLKLVQFDGNFFTATDSHVLLRINAKHVTDIPEGLEIGSLIDPKTLEVKTGNYPETSRLIPQNGYNTSTIILDKNSLKEVQTELKAAKKLLTKKHGYLTLELWDRYNKLITIEKQNKENVRINETELNTVLLSGQEIKINVDHKYLLNAIETAKKLTNLNSNPLEIRFISHLRPIHITQYEVLDILVLPIRVY